VIPVDTPGGMQGRSTRTRQDGFLLQSMSHRSRALLSVSDKGGIEVIEDPVLFLFALLANEHARPGLRGENTVLQVRFKKPAGASLTVNQKGPHPSSTTPCGSWRTRQLDPEDHLQGLCNAGTDTPGASATSSPQHWTLSITITLHDHVLFSTNTWACPMYGRACLSLLRQRILLN